MGGCNRGCQINVEKCNESCPRLCCSNYKRCCYCSNKAVPSTAINESNVDKIVNAKEYNNWLKHSMIQENRKWFYWLTFHVDLYCWITIIANIIGVIIAHIIPFMYLIDKPHKVENWNTCHMVNGDPITWADLFTCVNIFHLIEGTLAVIMAGTCIYSLFYWSFSRLALFQKILTLCYIMNVALMIYEGTVCWITLIRGAPWYQTVALFSLLAIIVVGVYYGAWILYNIFVFLQKAHPYIIEYPKTETDIIRLVSASYADRGKIRVVGSKHSSPFAIYVDDQTAPKQIMMSLDEYTGVEIVKLTEEEIKGSDDEEIIARAKVKGGTCLGYNRDNPLSTKENGLVYILQKKGFSLPDIGGVVNQTVGGFTATGCAGGTLYHDYYESIHSIRMINGKGEIVIFTKPKFENDKNYNDPYWGVIVSMGLMGVISEITYNLKASYNVLGSQIVWPLTVSKPKYPISWQNEECVLDEQKIGYGDGTGTLDIYAHNNEPNSLYNLIKNPKNKHKTEYFRMFSWPQTNPILLTAWKGHRELKEGKDALPTTFEWKKLFLPNGKFRPVYYHELDEGVKGVWQQQILSLLYNFFNHFINEETMILPQWVADTIKLLAKTVNPCPGTQYFGAPWCDILPMDQEMWTELMPIQFTELWIDIEDTDKAMRILKDFWEDNEGLKHTGTFSWEFYAARAGGYANEKYPGGAWIRPTYGRQSFRIDILWFDVKTTIPYVFFQQIWDRFVCADVPVLFRPHWGKWYPGGNVEFPKKSKLSKKFKKWNDYYKSLYPRWNDWHNLRIKMDPENIFVSTFWASTLNLQIPEAPIINGNKAYSQIESEVNDEKEL